MGIDLYYVPGSAPCRTVLLAAKALNLPLNLKLTNLKDGEHLKPEFVKINPMHCVPTLVDGDLTLWESRAIVQYLANKYGKGGALYPEDPKQRALVDQRLYFDMGTLYLRFSEYLYPQVFAGAPADKEKLAKVEEALKYLDGFLAKSKFAAGDSLTIADLSLVATVSSFEAGFIDLTKFSNVYRWYQLVQTSAPGYQEANQKGLDAFKAMCAHIKKD